MVLHDRVDDVERAHLRAAAARLDRDDRRRPDVARPVVCSGGWPRRLRAAAHGRRPDVPDGLPQGGPAARPRLRPSSHPRAGLPPARRCRARATTTPTSSSAPTSCCINGSGGTDICRRVRLGQLRCSPSTTARSPAAAWAPTSRPSTPTATTVVGELGEMVITEPMPSMPVRLLERHGRRALPLRLLRRLSRRMAPGRLDPASPSAAAASSPGAPTRRSTAAACAWAPASSTRSSRRSTEVADSADRAPRGRRGRRRRADPVRRAAPTGSSSTTSCARGSRARCAQSSRPRHVPDAIVAVPSVPRTMTGKKLEAPVKRILLGARAEQVASRDSLARPRGARRLRGLRGGARLSLAPRHLGAHDRRHLGAEELHRAQHRLRGRPRRRSSGRCSGGGRTARARRGSSRRPARGEPAATAPRGERSASYSARPEGGQPRSRPMRFIIAR